jgi:hydroxymethylpyrimidine pyrophosphatase-like HAD family hydrolase
VFHSAGLGDSENDLPMLRRCGMAAAVANASDIVLASVDLTVGACEDNGVAEFLQMLHSLNVEVA